MPSIGSLASSGIWVPCNTQNQQTTSRRATNTRLVSNFVPLLVWIRRPLAKLEGQARGKDCVIIQRQRSPEAKVEHISLRLKAGRSVPSTACLFCSVARPNSITVRLSVSLPIAAWRTAHRSSVPLLSPAPSRSPAASSHSSAPHSNILTQHGRQQLCLAATQFEI